MNRLTQILAIWGAVVATVALGWNISSSIRDRGELHISAEKIATIDSRSETTSPGSGLFWGFSSHKNLRVKLCNVGRKPLVISRVLLEYTDSQTNTRSHFTKDLLSKPSLRLLDSDCNDILTAWESTYHLDTIKAISADNSQFLISESDIANLNEHSYRIEGAERVDVTIELKGVTTTVP